MKGIIEMHRFNICLVVVLSLSCSGVKAPLELRKRGQLEVVGHVRGQKGQSGPICRETEPAAFPLLIFIHFLKAEVRALWPKPCTTKWRRNMLLFRIRKMLQFS